MKELKTKEDDDGDSIEASNYCVYIHTFPNDKVYIGMTCVGDIRWGKGGSGYTKKGQPLMYNAINKYGWENIEHKIISDGLSRDSAEKLEETLIAEYKSNTKSCGYNSRSGGNSPKHSEDTRKKMSASHLGVKLSQETRDRMSASKTGSVVSEETRLKISTWHSGKPKSDEMKKKISELHSGKTVSEESRRKISEGIKRSWITRKERKCSIEHCGI